MSTFILEPLLDPLMRKVMEATERWAAETPLPELARARFADLCRDLGMRPVGAAPWEALVGSLDEEGLQRLHVAVEALREANLGLALQMKQHVEAPIDALTLLQRGVGEVLEATRPVTMELLLESPLRVEEFARHLVARLRLKLRDEDAAASRERLARLDYRALLQQAEAARADASDRLAYLQKLQEDLEERRMPRGKW